MIVSTPGQLIQPDTQRQRNPNSRLTQRLGDARFHTLDLGRAEAGEGALVLGATEARADGTLEVGNGSSNGGSALTTGLGWLRRRHDWIDGVVIGQCLGIGE